MKELDITVISVMLRHSNIHIISNNTKPQNMKELDIPVISVMIDHSTTKVILNDTKPQNMKELDILDHCDIK